MEDVLKVFVGSVTGLEEHFVNSDAGVNVNVGIAHLNHLPKNLCLIRLHHHRRRIRSLTRKLKLKDAVRNAFGRKRELRSEMKVGVSDFSARKNWTRNLSRIKRTKMHPKSKLKTKSITVINNTKCSMLRI